MNIYVFLKVFADLCLYFGCIGALPALFPFDFYFLWPAIVCAACAAIAAFLSDHGRNAARFPFLLLTASCLILGSNVMEWLILIPPVANTIAMIVKDEWSMEYFHFREVFQKTLIVMAVALLVVLFGGIIEAGGHKETVLDSTALLTNTLIYTACGIILQRQLRLGSNTARDRYLNNLQLALVTIGAALILICIMAAERFLASRGISLRDIIGQGLKTIVGIPVYLIGYLISLLMGLDSKVLKKIEEANAVETEPSPTAPLPPMGEGVLQQPQAAEPAFPWWLAVLILAALTCSLILLTRILRSRRTEPDHSETVAQIQPEAKEKQPSRRSNRSKLRKTYREFLKAEKRKGHKLYPWQTSQDILEGLRPGSNSDAAARLRSIYLSARYDLNSRVTPEQVQAAKGALKQYKNE